MPFDIGTPDSYRFYLKAGSISDLEKKYLKGSNWLFVDQVKHNTYDSYWQARDLSRHMKNVKCAVLVVGGWYDAEDLSGPYRTFYATSQVQSGDADDAGGGAVGAWRLGARRWSHLGDMRSTQRPASTFSANVQFPFFEHYLKGKGAAPAQSGGV